MKNTKISVFTELALKQVDNLGHQLNKYGITNRLNRHNCIAILITQQQKLKGELARAELHWGLLKLQLKQLKQRVRRNN